MGYLHSADCRENSREQLERVIRPGFQREEIFCVLCELLIYSLSAIAVIFLD